jgi:hypothetical protein
MAPVRDRVLIMRMMSAGVGGLMSDFVPRGGAPWPPDCGRRGPGARPN